MVLGIGFPIMCIATLLPVCFEQVLLLCILLCYCLVLHVSVALSQGLLQQRLVCRCTRDLVTESTLYRAYSARILLKVLYRLTCLVRRRFN